MNEAVDLGAAARRIFERTLAAIDVESVVRRHLRLSGDRLEVGEAVCGLAQYSRLIIVSVGKASVPMARAAEEILGGRVTDGLAVTNALTGAAPARLRVILGGHPLPNAGSLEAARAALEMLRAADGEDTLVLFLISGGGSALFEQPVDAGLTLEDLREINRVLVGCGAVIGEMNVVRRFLSAVKGGRLAEAAPRARQISLYVSDVNSDDLTTISSGPTLASEATRADFDRIVARYGLLDKFPPHVARLIASGALPDPPRADAARSRLRSHHLLLDNAAALEEARRIAEAEGFAVEVAADLVEGDVEEMARLHLTRVAQLRARHPGRAVCLLSGGEVICPVRGDGQGGRNQEFVLRAAMSIHGESVTVLSAGTDGIDGNSPAAGAIADGSTVSRALAMGLLPNAYCVNSDSFTFFYALGDALITGPTGNNVRDLRMLLAR
jgi:glycerate 2-kinase